MKRDNTRTYDAEYVTYEFEGRIAFSWDYWRQLDSYELERIAKMAAVIIESSAPAVAAKVLGEANIFIDGFNAIVPRKDEDRQHYYPIKFGWIEGKHIVHDYDNLKW